VQVAFHLRRRPTAAPASGLLLLSHDTADLARLFAAVGHDPLPPVYAVADGFLLKLPRPTSGPFGGALRLRDLGDNLFVPVDAELLPALLPDEAANLGRQRGLVFLPGGRALEFDPARPLPLSAVAGAGELRRQRWQPLPEPAPLAERLTAITLERPELPPDELLAPGGEEIGTEDPRPQDTNLPSRAAGRAAFGAGRALAWLGGLLGMRSLAAAGARWMGAGLGMAPRLAESVLGRQEATLRALLRAFREGDIERALRRALPLGGGERGATPTGATNLPVNDLRYSLRNILGDVGGAGGTWLSADDLYHELAREYRRQAELAAQRGDYLFTVKGNQLGLERDIAAGFGFEAGARSSAAAFSPGGAGGAGAGAYERGEGARPGGKADGADDLDPDAPAEVAGAGAGAGDHAGADGEGGDHGGSGVRHDQPPARGGRRPAAVGAGT
jgi:hypothetical protein